MDHQRAPGKQKEDAAPPPSNGKEPSMSSRIAASASGLAKDLLGSASADEAQSSFASGSDLSRKLPNGGTGAAGPSTWSRALPSRQNGSSSRASAGTDGISRSQEGFREQTSTSETQELGIDAFVDDNFDFQTFLHEDHNTGESFPPQAQSGFSGGPKAEDFTAAWNRASGHGDYDDGAEVRQLLSNPAFSIDDPADMQIADPTPETVNDLFGLDYTPQEKEIVDKIKSALPPPPQHNGVSPDNPLNLRPEFASSSASNPRLEQGIRNLSRTLGPREESYVTFDDAQQEHWLAEWDDVLNGYTDEVWGDMLPVVKAARSQLQEVKAGMDRLDSKAVARLRMILGHVVDTKQMSSTQPGAQQQVSDSGMQDLRQLHQPTRPHISTDGQNYAVQQPSGQQPIHEEQHVQRKEEQKSEEDSGLEAPTFHCPYISCHEKFHNKFELQMHSKQHKGFACPHFDCADRFEDSSEWAEHINRAHHGLLEARPEDEDTGV